MMGYLPTRLADPLPPMGLEPPDPKPIGCCEYCSEPIYPGDSHYEVDGRFVEASCFESWAARELGAVRYR